MNDVLQRILSLIPKKENGDYRYGAKKEFCDSIGISSQNLSDWIAGRSTKYMDKLYEISNVYGVSVSWLKTGVKEEEDIDAEFLNELRSLKDDKNFRSLMSSYRRMSPSKVRIMKSFMKSLEEGDDIAD